MDDPPGKPPDVKKMQESEPNEAVNQINVITWKDILEPFMNLFRVKDVRHVQRKKWLEYSKTRYYGFQLVKTLIGFLLKPLIAILEVAKAAALKDVRCPTEEELLPWTSGLINQIKQRHINQIRKNSMMTASQFITWAVNSLFSHDSIFGSVITMVGVVTIAKTILGNLYSPLNYEIKGCPTEEELADWNVESLKFLQVDECKN